MLDLMLVDISLDMDFNWKVGFQYNHRRLGAPCKYCSLVLCRHWGSFCEGSIRLSDALRYYYHLQISLLLLLLLVTSKCGTPGDFRYSTKVTSATCVARQTDVGAFAQKYRYPSASGVQVGCKDLGAREGTGSFSPTASLRGPPSVVTSEDAIATGVRAIMRLVEREDGSHNAPVWFG